MQCLTPFIQVGYAVVSVIFICSCVGFIAGSLANVYMTDRYNFGLVCVIHPPFYYNSYNPSQLLVGGSLCQAIAYAIQASAPPFPLFCLAGAINGFGISIQDAQANGLVASLHENASEKMGLLHGMGTLLEG
jgi:MFS family permease